jgi:DegV family protein with EDD domain
MEGKIQVITDSSCDLPRRVVERLGILVVPLIVRFGLEQYLEGELSVDEFWEKAAGPSHPQTSQPSVGAMTEVFEPVVALGKQILCLTITSKHSGTFNSAYLAAQGVGGVVRVFDSQGLSLGLGFQALAAAQAVLDGRAMDEILAMLENLRGRTHMVFVLDTLENIRRGGRADRFIAVADRMARVLNVKAIINFVDGELRLMGAARSFDGGLRRLVKLVGELGPLQRLAVVHTRSQEVAEGFADRLAGQFGFPRDEIWVRETGAVLGTHAGPGVVGVVAVAAQ